jgi:hypothetical protein
MKEIKITFFAIFGIMLIFLVKGKLINTKSVSWCSPCKIQRYVRYQILRYKNYVNWFLISAQESLGRKILKPLGSRGGFLSPGYCTQWWPHGTKNFLQPGGRGKYFWGEGLGTLCGQGMGKNNCSRGRGKLSWSMGRVNFLGPGVG